jgi:hypothetical protein
MSYPRQIQPLVIEDETKAKADYQDIFERLNKRGMSISDPHFAFCLRDAEAHLASDTIYHLVILDLRLPEGPDDLPLETQTHGLGLLDRCLQRNHYPIPSLMVVSGHLGSVAQTELERKVKSGFAYGCVIVKGGDLEPEISTAVQQVYEYCDSGLHLRCSQDKVFPTLSPRDVDLLRRAAIQNGLSVGLNLQWWSAEYDPPTGEFADAMGWTKVLFGRYILEHGKGLSRYTFFKLAPSGGAEYVHREAALLQHKLKHIKVIGSIVSGDRSLLVTENASDGDKPPISLETFLGRPPDEVSPQSPLIVRRIVDQVASLGTSTPDSKPVGELLWPYHNEEWIKAQWERRGGSAALELGDEADPFKSRVDLIQCRTALRYQRQQVLHGDLNFTNVTLDDEPYGVTANIFDASGTRPGVNVRDLAMLEVTTLLHQSDEQGMDLVKHCSILYRDSIAPPGEIDFETGSTRARNTLKLIVDLRRLAVDRAGDPRVYALMVFDNALMQLGGLWLGSSVNKIRIPSDAAYLAGLTSKWLRRMAPEFFSLDSPTA